MELFSLLKCPVDRVIVELCATYHVMYFSYLYGIVYHHPSPDTGLTTWSKKFLLFIQLVVFSVNNTEFASIPV